MSIQQGPGMPSVSVTFDNLGEAAQLELGMWPQDVPQGQHFTVTEVLPRLLELLETKELSATFFVEGINALMYPQALHSIADGGHELALHAWRHEQWGTLDEAPEIELLTRATDAMRSIGLAPLGFRPPGGVLTERTLGLLAELGYNYVSPAGSREGILDGLAVLPFRWPLVDAYAFLPNFEGLRERFGGSPDPLGPEQMCEQMIGALRSHAQSDGHLTLIFHPFSMAFTAEPGWAALEAVLDEISRLHKAGMFASVRMEEAASLLLAQPPELIRAPQLDEATWAGRPA